MTPAATAEVIHPDEVLDAPEVDPEVDPEEQERQDRFDALNPCQVCEAHQHEGPEGEAWYNGHHTALHCWRCGYRPGQAVSPTVTLGRPGLDQARLTQAMNELRSSVVGEILSEFRKAGVLPQHEAETKQAIEGAVDRVVDPPPPTGDGG